MSQVINTFLEQCDPKDQTVRNALSLANKEMQVFWAALNAVGEDLVIPDFTKIAGKIAKFPSPYINKIAKAGLVEHGAGRGKWSVSSKALKKMKAIIDGDVAEAPPERETLVVKKAKKSSKKKAEGKASKARVGRQMKFTQMTVSALLEKLELKVKDLTGDIDKLAAERDGVKLSIAAIKDTLK